jgi:hypothetical protein
MATVNFFPWKSVVTTCEFGLFKLTPKQYCSQVRVPRHFHQGQFMDGRNENSYGYGRHCSSLSWRGEQRPVARSPSGLIEHRARHIARRKTKSSARISEFPKGTWIADVRSTGFTETSSSLHYTLDTAHPRSNSKRPVPTDLINPTKSDKKGKTILITGQ